ncbi:3'-5' exonuclease [Solirubrobacter soli]|uniref:3'-5' exonuclease n=1 Tax=Solirubrobacter soli TaxID=363832 RepID=UPI0004006324|nr:3'-5' exoribonuclease [Solirubrobacter soli]
MAGVDVYISVDVEADGPIPLVHSLSSLGAAVAGTFDGTTFTRLDPTATTFYAELQPVGDEFDVQAAAVAGLDRERLAREGETPADGMTRFAAWVREAAGDGRPVFVAYPAAFDWTWVSIYLARFAPENPFGFSGVFDMKSLYMTKARVRIGKAAKRAMPAHLLSTRAHTHNALDDAIEQADLFANLFEWSP